MAVVMNAKYKKKLTLLCSLLIAGLATYFFAKEGRLFESKILTNDEPNSTTIETGLVEYDELIHRYPLDKSGVVLSLDAIFKTTSDKKAVFRSKPCSISNNLEVAFMQNDLVCITEFCENTNKYVGTYEIDERGVISLEMDSCSNKWPDLRYIFGRSGDFLCPIKSGEIMGNALDGNIISEYFSPDAWPVFFIGYDLGYEKLIKFIPPELPKTSSVSARILNIDVEVLVDTDGGAEITYFDVLNSPEDEMLGESNLCTQTLDALKSAIEKWEYSPYMIEGVPQASVLKYNIEYYSEGGGRWVIKQAKGSIIYDSKGVQSPKTNPERK